MPGLSNTYQDDHLNLLNISHDLNKLFCNVSRRYSSRKLDRSSTNTLETKKSKTLIIGDSLDTYTKIDFKNNFLHLLNEFNELVANAKCRFDLNKIKTLLQATADYIQQFQQHYPHRKSLHAPSYISVLRHLSFKALFQYEVVNYYKKHEHDISRMLKSTLPADLVITTHQSKQQSFYSDVSQTESENSTLLNHKPVIKHRFMLRMNMFSRKIKKREHKLKTTYQNLP